MEPNQRTSRRNESVGSIRALRRSRAARSTASELAVARNEARRAFVGALIAGFEGTIMRVPPEFPEFASSRLWINTKSSEVVRFEVNAIQRRYLATKAEAVARKKRARFVVLKFRRGGITTLEQGLSYYVATTRRNSTVATLTHTLDATNRIFRIPLLMYERDPDKPALKGRAKDPSPPLVFPDLNSIFFVGTAGGRAFGRGDTLHRVHGSEVSRWFERETNRMELQQDLISGLTEAASHGEVVLESTAKGFEYFQHLYSEAKRGQGDWTPIFLPWFFDSTNAIPLEEREAREFAASMDDDEADIAKRYSLSPEQVAWRRWKKSQPEMRGLFEQEYPEDDASCFRRSGVPYFAFDVESILEATPDEGSRGIPGGLAYVWEEPRVGVRYVAGGDTSEGLPSGDYACLGILRADTGEQVACLRGRWGVAETARLFAEWCRRYNDAFLGVESENTGHAVVMKLQELGYSGPRRLFARNVTKDRHGALRSPDVLREGWSTNAQTRPMLLAALSEAVAGGLMRVRDRQLLVEMMRFNLQSNGRFEADQGQHDDSIFAWGIAWQMRLVPVARPAMMFMEL